ncbi:hypothetical protein [Pseudomonas fluorescens]|nr:hypothetical protein [Pseudomonas fluorescens]WJK09494.1 hypothetical protein QR290_27385 [Pseudomonas fluorescens]
MNIDSNGMVIKTGPDKENLRAVLLKDIDSILFGENEELMLLAEKLAADTLAQIASEQDERESIIVGRRPVGISPPSRPTLDPTDSHDTLPIWNERLNIWNHVPKNISGDGFI